MLFSELAETLDTLEKTSSRIDITKQLSDLFERSNTEEIDKLVYLILGRLAPSYKGLVFNVAEQTMLDAISSAFNVEVNDVKHMYQEKGDLGITAQEFAERDKSQLSVSEVYDRLREIAELEGGGSVDQKTTGLAELIRELDSLSVRYVSRIPVGKLRLGFSDKTVIDALSWMIEGDKSISKKIKRKYEVYPDVGALAKNIKEVGVDEATKDSTPQIGMPISPMLASRIKSPKTMIEKMGEVAIEPKLDGLRIQIHFDRKESFIAAYTRNMNEVTWMFPELNELGKHVKAEKIILDVEAIGLDPDRKALANFQTTMTRRRKHEVKETAEKVPIKFYVFDLLLRDDENLMNKKYLDRRTILEKIVKNGSLLELTEYVTTEDPQTIIKENEAKRAEGLEGIIVKKINAKYVPGRTGHRWVKMKESEKSAAKLADTVDCLVMGYYRGRGKRTEFGIGGFLAGVVHEEKFLTLTKVGTGLTDEQFREMEDRLSKLKAQEQPPQYDVHKDLFPDYWVTPEVVVELAADDITKSPNHTAGYALRFPRLVKFRDDKDPDQSTTLSEIKNLYKMQ